VAGRWDQRICWAIAAMVNIIGTQPTTAEILAVPGAALHLYDKSPMPDRKLGHITVVEQSRAQVDAALQRLQGIAGLGLTN